MEDVVDTVLAAMHCLEKKGIIDGDDPGTDKLFNALQEVLEIHFNYPDYARSEEHTSELQSH